MFATARLYRRYLIAAFFVAIWLIGTIGWHQTVASMGWPDAAYRSLALFVLDFPDPAHPSLALNVARFVAPIGPAWAIIAVLVRLAASQRDVTRAIRATGHVVIVGDGADVADLARGHAREGSGSVRGVRVVVVSSGSRDDAVGADSVPVGSDMFGPGVTLVSGLTDKQLGRVLRGARRTIVSGESDGRSADLARWVARVQAASEGSETPDSADTGDMVVLFDDADVVEHWAHTRPERAICRPRQVAASVLSDVPPYLESAYARTPIVIGDGDTAEQLAYLIATAWQDAGERREIHCIAPDDGWVRRVRSATRGAGVFTWHDAEMRASVVPEIAAAVDDSWIAPDRVQRFTVEGPRVYVAVDDATRAITIAVAVAKLLPTARVIVLVLATAAEREDSSLANVSVISASEALADPARLAAPLVADLTRQLLLETGRWPAYVPGVFGDASGEELERRAGQVAAAVEPALGDVGLEVVFGARPPARPVVLGPGELVLVAQRLSGLSDQGFPATEGFVRWLEFAARLPALVARTGWTVYRREGIDPFTADEVAAAALAAHQGYRELAAADGGATGSGNAQREWAELAESERMSNVAQVLDIPVKLAAMGLGWARARDAGASDAGASAAGADDPVVGDEDAALGEFAGFDDDQVEYLAELEHRRWEHFQYRNGRPGHEWNAPWSDLSEEVREYDRVPVRALPGVLARVGLRVVVPGSGADVAGFAN